MLGRRDDEFSEGDLQAIANGHTAFVEFAASVPSVAVSENYPVATETELISQLINLC